MNDIVKEAPAVELAASETAVEPKLLDGVRVDIREGNFVEVLAWIESCRREDGSVLIRDEVGRHERSEEVPGRPGSWRPAGKKIHDFVVHGDFMLASGQGLCGLFQRIVLKSGAGWSTVSIKNGVPTIGMRWTPSDFEYTVAKVTLKKELEAIGVKTDLLQGGLTQKIQNAGISGCTLKLTVDPNDPQPEVTKAIIKDVAKGAF